MNAGDSDQLVDLYLYLTPLSSIRLYEHAKGSLGWVRGLRPS